MTVGRYNKLPSAQPPSVGFIKSKLRDVALWRGRNNSFDGLTFTGLMQNIEKLFVYFIARNKSK